jgi:hypothetical protein
MINKYIVAMFIFYITLYFDGQLLLIVNLTHASHYIYNIIDWFYIQKVLSPC